MAEELWAVLGIQSQETQLVSPHHSLADTHFYCKF